LISSFEWDWRVSSALLSDFATCGTSWVHWAGGFLITLGVCQHLASSEFVGSLTSYRWLLLVLIVVIVRGPCAFPVGESWKATLMDCSWHCVASLLWFLQYPCVGLGVWCLLAHEPPSECLATTRT
jgi:hypothetical protein